MNKIVIQKNVFSTHEKLISGEVSAADRRDRMVCPKPRRLNDHLLTPLKWYPSHKTELCDSKAGDNILDLLLFKGSTLMESPPPFFSGSPPRRVANPLIQDDRFGSEKLFPAAQPPSPPPPPGRKSGCVPASFANNPTVRIEGFDCLDRDRRHLSIPALA